MEFNISKGQNVIVNFEITQLVSFKVERFHMIKVSCVVVGNPSVS